MGWPDDTTDKAKAGQRPAREPLYKDSDMNGARDSEAPSRRNGEKAEGRIFPLRLCKCCVPQFRLLIPTTWQVIQDCTHFTLVIGIFCAVFLLFAEVIKAIYEKKCTSEYCHQEIIIGFAVIPNLRYLSRMIGQYDEAIQVRERAIVDRKQDLISCYEELVSGIDDLLGKATQSSATLAESGFEGKRRDFVRFLDRCEERGALLVGTESDMAALLEQFKTFIRHWLRVFAECSVDPINNPKVVLTDSELAACGSIAEVANLAKERLKHTEVRFISHAHEKDSKLLRGFRATHRRLSQAHTPMALLDLGGTGAANASNAPPSSTEIELSTSVARPRNGEAEKDIDTMVDHRARPPASAHSLDVSGLGNAAKRWCPCQWCVLGLYRCACESSDHPDGFPTSVQLKCAKLVLLSQDHLFLMIGCLFSLVLIICIVADSNSEERPGIDWWVLLPGVGYVQALSILLIRFEQIDIIQKLEREINRLEEESAQLQQRREQMVQFWTDMQQLTDIWVYRTTPRLDMLKECHSCFEDMKKPDDFVHALAGTNNRLEVLDSKLPELALWRTDGGISEADKKKFAHSIKRIYDEADQDLPRILSGISQLCDREDGIPAIKDVPKAAPRSPRG